MVAGGRRDKDDRNQNTLAPLEAGFGVTYTLQYIKELDTLVILKDRFETV